MKNYVSLMRKLKMRTRTEATVFATGSPLVAKPRRQRSEAAERPASGRQSAKNACRLAGLQTVPRLVWRAGQSASGWSSRLTLEPAP